MQTDGNTKSKPAYFIEDKWDLDEARRELEHEVTRKKKNRKILSRASIIMTVLAFVAAYVLYYAVEYVIGLIMR